MKKPIIKELSRADRLDGRAKAAVRGGWSLNPPGYDDGYSPHGGLPIHPDAGDRSVSYRENPAANDVPGLDRAGACTAIFQRGQFKIFAN
jgi:hypothetical protein